MNTHTAAIERASQRGCTCRGTAGGADRESCPAPIRASSSARLTTPAAWEDAAGGFLRGDGAEAISNATIGLGVSVLAVWTLWPLFGWEATGGQSVAVTALFFALSTVSTYIIRKAFRWLQS